MPIPSPADDVDELPARLRPVVARIVPWAFGVAVATVCAGVLGLFAAYHAFLAPGAQGSAGVALLGYNFLPGYEATPLGALMGVLWGLVVGFGAGFLFAFGRNAVLGLSIFLVRMRQRAAADSTILDDLV